MDVSIKLRLIGTKPLLLHNGRLANPMDPYARQLATASKPRKKTDVDYENIANAEMLGSIYEDDGLLAFPTSNVWRSIYDAAKSFRLGEDVKRALTPVSFLPPILIDNAEVKIEPFLQDPDNRYTTTVKIQRNRVPRTRPIVYNWSMLHEFELSSDVIDPGNLPQILNRAGRMVGLGDWRPTFGTFTWEIEE